MKKLVTLALVTMLVAALSVNAFAQPEQHDAGVFFDSLGTQTSTTVGAFGQFNLYVVGFDLDGLVFGFEGEVISTEGWFAEDGFGVTRLGTSMTGPSPLNVGNDVNFIVGTGGCVDGSGAFVAVTYTCGWFTPTAPADMTFCLLASTPSSFTPAAPGYLRCNGELQAWGVAENGLEAYPDGCAVANPLSDPPVSTEAASFGAVKAGF